MLHSSRRADITHAESASLLHDGVSIMRKTLSASLLVGGASLAAIALVAATAVLSAPAFANEMSAAPHPFTTTASRI